MLLISLEFTPYMPSFQLTYTSYATFVFSVVLCCAVPSQAKSFSQPHSFPVSVSLSIQQTFADVVSTFQCNRCICVRPSVCVSAKRRMHPQGLWLGRRGSYNSTLLRNFQDLTHFVFII